MILYMKQKPIVVHIHILKNAGTTIDWILQKNFGVRSKQFDGNDPDKTLSQMDLLKFVSTYPETVTVSSFQIRFPLPEHIDFFFLPMFFIRHPIDRAFSVYSFYKRFTNEHPQVIAAHNLSLDEFLKWELESKYATIKDCQVMVLSKDDNFSKVGVNDLQLVIKRMKDSSITGVWIGWTKALCWQKNF